jgi:hypothetical protein
MGRLGKQPLKGKPPQPGPQPTTRLALPYSDGIATDVDVFTLSNTLQPGQSDADTSRLGTIVGRSVIAHGVHGVNGAGAGTPQYGTGVWGESDNGFGVCGASQTNSGVQGTSTGFDGVHGESQSPQHAGVSGKNNGGGIGVYGASSGRAGYFAGHLHADGDLSAGGNLTANRGTFAADVGVLGTLTVNGDHNVRGTVTALVDVVVGSDCAEDFDIAPSTEVEPGTVMVLTENGALQPSYQSYDRKVAGVISGAGEYKPGLILGRRDSSRARRPLALVGKVYCKVDAGYSPVEIGDLLTTSPTLGHAMKASDASMAFGAVIGKSLGRLPSGRGIIPILIALQ